MNREEAKQQLENFFRRLGSEASLFNEQKFVQARVGESFVGFEFDEADDVLSCQALIYRFRREPRDEVLDALFAEETPVNNGGGRIVFDSKTFALYLQRDFAEKIDDASFYEQVNQLARASLIWNGEIVEHAAAKVSAS
ncbi:MAG TPA: type III secretion system chaperone [Pyrinomonadaceae bacterium]|nr:type III secretion system chaperone [Pyrinomonadaceae bacterium]